ncbi:xeroderma pigmentosum group C-complementing protein, variant [Blastomyces dermatitidis ATCC 18188]|uniref:Xeroderma pigmentosum group C-complementing protein n=1 Tax=Ajellomyces dermatitidis (strain ATCC 18188 / CBS 674.68) TaxID=653446 RepID=F2TV09_AJEDA|nr:xeroderma pigmentosum group C-complementing protein [Blastomyces dermatitidis ATCC 18188]KMW69474.1 xeroderma pigmentosum group C-complementing protein, variant [Blastomyces dermatitidis ATCC 18188]
MVKQSRHSRVMGKGKAPVRGPARAAEAERASGSRSRRGRGHDQERAAPDPSGEIPLVYRDMLAESGAGVEGQSGRSGSLSRASDERPVKRRRVGERRAGRIEAGKGGRDERGGGVGVYVGKPVQTVYDVDVSDDEEEMEWEDVEVSIVTPAAAAAAASASTSASASGLGYHGAAEQQEVGVEESEELLQITLEKPEKGKQRAAAVRRKPITAQEKRWRLDLHKMHVLCLLGHVQLRNLWCNDDKVQNVLKRLLSKHTVMCLNPKETLPQFTRSTTFADGLNQATEAFRRHFKVTVPGMKRPYWLENPNELKDPTGLLDTAEILSSKEDFLKQAVALRGSRDLGAQLFCALLRAVGVDVRLVCSLQVLPFAGVAKGIMPLKPEREYIVVSEDDGSLATHGSTKTHETAPSSRIRRIGQPRFSSSPAPSPKPRLPTALPRAFSESPFPVFWVEAFNEAMQKWVPVDPIVTNTVGKPSKFEPPASDRYNNMSYVIAFEDDASARDVTKRYTKSFNSKTRKQRVESTKNGEEWWARTMNFFEKPFLDDRDQVEIGELTAKVAAEMMPRNVQDFKDHPVYALERHLRRNEVIFPRREIGKVGLSKVSTNKKNPPLESVYRRGDVHVVKSADGWYRLGREVKVGEQPLKRVPVSRSKGDFEHREELSDYEEEGQETPMYAIHQTDLYQPPPVVENRVTKNAYGNIDVYTPSMVPEGGFHLRHTEAANAARILGIDYADAVTGFQFRGRHGTAVVQGIVASVEYRDALCAVLDALEDERVQAEHEKRTAEALGMWKLLLLKLRVAERVRSYAFEGEGDEEEEEEKERVSDGDENDDIEGGGGFIRESGQVEALPSQKGLPQFEGAFEAGGFIPEGIDGEEDSTTTGGGFMPPILAPDEAGSSTSATAIGSNSLRPQEKSRYTLIVTPNAASEAHLPQPHTSPTTTPSHAQTARQQTQAQQTHTPQRQQPQSQSQLQQQRPPTTTAPEGSPTAPIAVPSSGSDEECSVEEICGVPDLVHEGESDSEIDQSSMLSHDPEDEDAEPEWLFSD